MHPLTPAEQARAQADDRAGGAAVVVPLRGLDYRSLALVGGKAANLGALIAAGFSVPDGFCVTTTAYQRVAQVAALEPLLADLMTAADPDESQPARRAQTIRDAVLHAPIPLPLVTAITEAYRTLDPSAIAPVAVRSSATAEDLPGASFAGQQDTVLNVVGTAALLAAVQQCWASLWTARAVSYRARLGIDPRTVALAVVVQRMVEARVAGVLFTANPVRGTRRQTVIDANPGLGEAVVAGTTNPDHFVVATSTGAILDRRLGDKQLVVQARAGGGTEHRDQAAQPTVACLTDEQIRALTTLGARIEAAFGAPQDIEWAIDDAGQLVVLQARPMTTLFPLPPDAPMRDAELRVFLAFTVQQGTEQPFTPLGISAIRRLASAVTTVLGRAPADPEQGPRFVTEAAGRIFFDVTAALRTGVGRRMLTQMMAEAEVRAAQTFGELQADPRLALRPLPRRAFVRSVVRLLLGTRLLAYMTQALVAPDVARRRVARLERALRSNPTGSTMADPVAQLAAVERMLDATPRLLFDVSPVMLAGMQTYALAGALLGDLASADELQLVLRGAPHNPTTAMTLALWALAQQARTDPAVTAWITEQTPASLAAAYHAGELPRPLQGGLALFLARYGHRSVNELDLGAPRWTDDPTYVLTILAGYLQHGVDRPAPDAQHRRAAVQAEWMLAALVQRAARQNPLRGLLVSRVLRRARALSGMREQPRALAALLLAQVRTALRPVADALVNAGRLAQADDIVYLSLPEAAAALGGADVRALVRERTATYRTERLRRHVPLVLLSDGTVPTVPAEDGAGLRDTLRGTPASPGRVTATARVLSDPAGGALLPGEILVAPATDPGWTPLFWTAAGLVMELGGTTAHGAIVAREVGIPAVVGVAGATTRITTGQWITVDGRTGTVSLVEDAVGQGTGQGDGSR